MIHFDVTKTGPAAHRSGLTRVSARLREELGAAAAEVQWPAWPMRTKSSDWLVTAELFSEEERPGVTEYLRRRECRTAAIFHDAIPLKHPHITWPQSVARHPSYLKLLAQFERVWAVSSASRQELMEFWSWQGLESTPPVEVLPLGADFNRSPRAALREPASVPMLLCVGIVEPRKNQAFLLEVCEQLWRDGLNFELHVVGRVNPHFGNPIVERLRALRREGRPARFHESASDAELARLYAGARATVFPTIAEGCGLPLLESLWMGVPCVCSDLPVLRENAAGGGCLAVPVNDAAAWADALRRVLTETALIARLTSEAARRELPTWSDAANLIVAASDS
jgi:glycosyltransferase involved in cell wall biosynthesis